MRSAPCNAQLILNGRVVGDIAVRGWEGAWGFGDFTPGDAFTEFAPLYGRWSLLMHADDDAERLSADAAEELREVEQAQYRIHAQLLLPATSERREIVILNIDGPLIEWKEGPRPCACGTCENRCGQAHERRPHEHHADTPGEKKPISLAARKEKP